jgi:hypothetical protein
MFKFLFKFYFLIIIIFSFCKEIDIKSQKIDFFNKHYDLGIRSFIPFDLFSLNHNLSFYDSKNKKIENYFLGDGHNRKFTFSKNTSARIHYYIRFNIERGRMGEAFWSSDVHRIIENNQVRTLSIKPALKYISPPEMEIFPNGDELIKISTHIERKNPFLPYVFDINLFSDLSIIENTKKNYLKIKGKIKGDKFQSVEIFIEDPSEQILFIGVCSYEGNAKSLFGVNKNELIRFDFDVKTDNQGNFKYIEEKGRKYTLKKWNKEVKKVKTLILKEAI